MCSYKKNFEGLQQNIISEYLGGQTVWSLAVKYGCSRPCMYRFLKEEGVYTQKYVDNINDFKDQIISEYVSGSNTIELGIKYHVCHTTITHLLERFNIPMRTQSEATRTYPLNESFFDNIDTPIKAYFLGFLYADGNNYTKKNEISIELSDIDKTHLEKLSSLIYVDNNKPELFYRAPKSTFDKKYQKIYTSRATYRLRFRNKHISEILDRHGMVPAKSLVLTFPDFLNKALYHHFIRGYFDGDGCLSFKYGDTRFPTISILGTKSFCTSIQKIISAKNIKSSVKCRNKTLYAFTISSSKAMLSFLDWIYQDADLYLQRKHDKYININRLFILRDR